MEAYAVVDNNKVILVCQDREDAVSTIKNLFGRSAKAIDMHLQNVTYVQNGITLTKENMLELFPKLLCSDWSDDENSTRNY